MTFSYDEDVDVLYITFSKPSSKATYLENDNGDILRFSEETKELFGVTIPSFMERVVNGETFDFPEIGLMTSGEGLERLIASRLRPKKPGGKLNISR